jgi:putative heme iron utilization protein
MQENTAFDESSGLQREKIEAARDTLLQLRTLQLAVNSQQDSPEMGVSPFIRRDDGLYIFTSHLSQHVRDLMAAGRATCMLCADEAKSQNIWARNRMKFTVDAIEIMRDDAKFDGLCDDFASAHGPTMDLIRNFGDFHMFQLTPRDGVLVLGFAKAFTVTGAGFDIAAHISKA